MSRTLRAFDWFEQGFQNMLVAHGIPTVNKTQSLMMLYIAAGVHRPSEIARRLRVTRQAIRQSSNELVKLGLIDVIDDEHDKRGRRLVYSKSSEKTKETALGIVDGLKEELRSRIGSERVDALDQILSTEWGDVVDSHRMPNAER